jgi:hypothetical protein
MLAMILAALEIMLVRLSVLAACLLVTACAVVPGYSPPPFKAKGKWGTPAESGSVGADGAYAMSEDEKKIDCKHLTGSIQISISRLRDPYFKQEPSAVAGAAHKYVAPAMGGSAVGSDRQAEYARERAKLDAYNRQLASKGCKTVDIEAELAKPPEGPKTY